MESEETRSRILNTAGEGDGGHGPHVCRDCGYTYPNPHPSAKARRAHRKHCHVAAANGGEEERMHSLPSNTDEEFNGLTSLLASGKEKAEDAKKENGILEKVENREMEFVQSPRRGVADMKEFTGKLLDPSLPIHDDGVQFTKSKCNRKHLTTSHCLANHGALGSLQNIDADTDSPFDGFIKKKGIQCPEDDSLIANQDAGSISVCQTESENTGVDLLIGATEAGKKLAVVLLESISSVEEAAVQRNGSGYCYCSSSPDVNVTISDEMKLGDKVDYHLESEAPAMAEVSHEHKDDAVSLCKLESENGTVDSSKDNAELKNLFAVPATSIAAAEEVAELKNRLADFSMDQNVTEQFGVSKSVNEVGYYSEMGKLYHDHKDADVSLRELDTRNCSVESLEESLETSKNLSDLPRASGAAVEDMSEHPNVLCEGHLDVHEQSENSEAGNKVEYHLESEASQIDKVSQEHNDAAVSPYQLDTENGAMESLKNCVEEGKNLTALPVASGAVLEELLQQTDGFSKIDPSLILNVIEQSGNSIALNEVEHHVGCKTTGIAELSFEQQGAAGSLCQPEPDNGAVDCLSGIVEGKNLIALPLTPSAAVEGCPMPTNGLCESYSCKDLNVTVPSNSKEGNDFPCNLGTITHEMVLSELVILKSDESVCGSLLKNSIHEIGLLEKVSSKASLSDETDHQDSQSDVELDDLQVDTQKEIQVADSPEDLSVNSYSENQHPESLSEAEMSLQSLTETLVDTEKIRKEGFEVVEQSKQHLPYQETGDSNVELRIVDTQCSTKPGALEEERPGEKRMSDKNAEHNLADDEEQNFTTMEPTTSLDAGSFDEKAVGSEDCNDLFELYAENYYGERTSHVESSGQADSSIVMMDHSTLPDHAHVVEGSDEHIGVYCSDVAGQDSFQENEADRSHVTVVSAEVVLRELGKETISQQTNAVESLHEIEERQNNDEVAAKLPRSNSVKSNSLRVLLEEAISESKEKKSFVKILSMPSRRKGSKEDAVSVKSVSPKTASDLKVWDSPLKGAVNKIEKRPKEKQPWVPFMCCPYIRKAAPV